MPWIDTIKRIADEMDCIEEKTGLLFDDERFARMMVNKARRCDDLKAAHNNPDIMVAAFYSYLDVLAPEIAEIIAANIHDIMRKEHEETNAQ